jgi:hypothetical protein
VIEIFLPYSFPFLFNLEQQWQYQPFCVPRYFNICTNLTGQIAKLLRENWPLRAMDNHIANWLQASGQIPNCDVIYMFRSCFDTFVSVS